MRWSEWRVPEKVRSQQKHKAVSCFGCPYCEYYDLKNDRCPFANFPNLLK